MASEDVNAESRYEKFDSDEGWFQDIAANLDTYVQLSIAGQYNRASWYFDDLLNTPDAEFPVVAQHADTMIDQGSFGEAEELLLTYQESHPPVRSEDEERHLILDLLLANTQMYTKCDTKRAAKTVTKALQMVGRVLIDDTTPPGKIAVISLRIVDLLLRMPHDRSVSAIDFELPFTTASEGEQNLDWHEVLISMLAVGYVWEAQTLLPICLRHAKSEDGTALLKILDAIPKEDDTVYTLVRCTMLREMSKFLAGQSWQLFTRMELYRQWQEMVEGGLDPSCPMDSMLTPISESRAYQEMELFRLKERTETHKSSFPHEADDTTPFDGAQDLQKIRAEAEVREDYMLVLKTYEQSEDSLPQKWLEKTGISHEALEDLHPNVQVSSRFPVQQQLIEQQITYADDKIPNVRDVHHDSISPHLANSDQRESPQGALGPFSLSMQQRAQNLKSLPRSQREAVAKRLPDIGNVNADSRDNGQTPKEFISLGEHDQYRDAKPVKTRKTGKTVKDPSSKVKKPVLPVTSRYEGWMITYVDVDKLQPGQTPSWSMSRKAQLPFGIQELRDLATEQEKRDGSLSSQFSKLCANQQEIVNRLVTEKNSAEQQTNAEWVLVCVKKLHKETRTAFRAYKINDRMQVIMLRREKPKEGAEPSVGKGIAIDDDDIINLSRLARPARKDASTKANEDSGKKAKSEKKKINKKEQPAEDNYGQWPESDPFNQQHDPFQQRQFQQDPLHQYQHREDPFHQHQHQQDPFHRHQQQQDPFQQYQQQQHDPFQYHQQQPYQQQEQPPYVDPYDIYGMSGALPHDDGRIPFPMHEYPPEAPMLPQHSNRQPFQPFARIPQADPRSYPRQHDPSDFVQPHFSARHGSHSRPRQEPKRELRRESVDNEKIRRKDVRKIGEILRTELLGEVRGEIRDALREAAAEDKVRLWPASGSYPATTSSVQSTGQDDAWSSTAPSDGRSYSHGTPDTSPDRSERFYRLRERPTGSFHRRDSSGYGSFRQDDRRYYQDRDRVVRPHSSQRERERYRDDGRARSPKYVSERRETVDDDPGVQYHRQQRQRGESKIYAEPRPRAQRRVTDYPSALPTANFDRRHRDSVDYTDPRVYGYYEERHSGREAVADDEEIADLPGLAKSAEKDLFPKGGKAGNEGEEGDKEGI